MNFKLYKNNNLSISRDNIAYLKNFDKIVFEIKENKFNILLNKDNIIFIKEDNDTIFNLDNKEAILTLKDNNINFPIKVEKLCIKNISNKYIIEYKLESDEDTTKIEIELI